MGQTPLATPKLSASQRYITFIHAALFVLGFSLIFIIGWGGAATVFGQLFGEYKQLIARVGGIVVMRFGENAQQVINRVKEKLEQLKKGLPDGVEIVPVYDRSALIERAVIEKAKPII